MPVAKIPCKRCKQHPAAHVIAYLRQEVCDNCFAAWKRSISWSAFDAPDDVAVGDDGDDLRGRRVF